MDFSVTQLRSIEHTWQTVISHIFHIKGADVQSICNYLTDVPFDTMLHDRRMRFLSQLCYVNNSSLQYLFNVAAKRELINVMRLCRSEPLARLWRDICQHCILYR